MSQRDRPPTSRAGVAALVLAAVAATWAPPVSAQGADPRAILADPAFANTYQTQYGYLANTSRVVLAEELRGVLEDVASGGSRVGSTSGGHRVRSFETVFLRRVQASLCGGGSSAAAGARGGDSVQSAVVAGSAAAGTESGLVLAMPELGRVSAIAVRLVERSDRAQLCRSTSLGDLAR